MVLRDEGLICPYCGSTETAHEREREDDSVYDCEACDRRFAGPSRS
jgi:ribosomal protein L37AE/L43A